MDSLSNFPIILQGTFYDGNIYSHVPTTFYCKEVPVKNTTYSKLVTSNGKVAILIQPSYGSDWSVYVDNPILKKQIVLDSRIVRYIASDSFKQRFIKCKHQISSEEFKDIMSTLIPEGLNHGGLNYRFQSFPDLKIMFIPDGCMFRINEYDGMESVEFFNIDNYIST
jgi:hypothetical protein